MLFFPDISDKIDKNCVCGEDRLSNKRVVGGKEVPNNTFRYYTVVSYETKYDPDTRFCGGVFINNLYVLTAASCFAVSFKVYDLLYT